MTKHSSDKQEAVATSVSVRKHPMPHDWDEARVDAWGDCIPGYSGLVILQKKEGGDEISFVLLTKEEALDLGNRLIRSARGGE